MSRYTDDPYYISPEQERELEYEALREKCERMRDAIDMQWKAPCVRFPI